MSALEWIESRKQWRCERCGSWPWTKNGDWLDRYAKCMCGREESLAATTLDKLES